MACQLVPFILFRIGQKCQENVARTPKVQCVGNRPMPFALADNKWAWSPPFLSIPNLFFFRCGQLGTIIQHSKRYCWLQLFPWFTNFCYIWILCQNDKYPFNNGLGPCQIPHNRYPFTNVGLARFQQDIDQRSTSQK